MLGKLLESNGKSRWHWGDDVLVDKDEMLLLKNMFKLRDKRSSEVALPRADISALSLTAKPDEIKKII